MLEEPQTELWIGQHTVLVETRAAIEGLMSIPTRGITQKAATASRRAVRPPLEYAGGGPAKSLGGSTHYPVRHLNRRVVCSPPIVGASLKGDRAMTSVTRQHPRTRSTLTILFALAATILTVAFAPTPAGAASPHQMRVFVCHGPSGEAALQEDWSIGAVNRVGWMYAEDTCANADQGYLGAALGASPYGFAGFPNEPYIYWNYSSPNWATIASFNLELPNSYAYPAPGGGVGEAWIEDSEKTDPAYDMRNLGGGTHGPTVVSDEAKGTMTSIQILAACDGGGGSCPAGTQISSIEVNGGSITLNDLTSPTASMIGGSLTDPAPVGGTNEISFHATDTNGPGIYSAWLETDGNRQPAINIGENTGLCRNLQPAGQTPAFDATQPCPRELDGSLALNTAILRDGQHTIKLYIQDAAGSSTVAWSGTIRTDNAPVVAASPVISGPAQVGSTLSASHGSYIAPAGAGSLSSVTGQWLRCTDEQAQHCSIIAGAANQTYTPITADTNYHLVYQDTISDSDGTTNADSAPTVPLTNPATSASCAQSSCPAGSAGGSGGSGTSPLPITINLPAGSLNADNHHLGSPAAWSISLRVRPTRVRKHTQITLTGRVHTRPLPALGKLVYLRARSVHTKLVAQGASHHLVTSYGAWASFAVLKTKPDGSFSFKYAFKQGGKHTYAVQAIAPQEGGYANAAGTSNTHLIHQA